MRGLNCLGSALGLVVCCMSDARVLVSDERGSDTAHRIRFANDLVIVNQDEFAGGSVLIEIAIEGGWFAPEGFGIRSFTGFVESSESDVFLPIPPGPGGMGGAASWEFWDGPTSGMGSTSMRLANVDWFRGPVLDLTLVNPPPPHGFNEFVPLGRCFVELTDSMARSIRLEAQSVSSNILSWVIPGHHFSWYVASSSEPETASAEMTIRIVGCACDLDGDGAVSSDDYFEFLQAFLIDADADFNGDGQTNSDDFFEFIACWGMPPVGC